MCICEEASHTEQLGDLIHQCFSAFDTDRQDKLLTA